MHQSEVLNEVLTTKVIEMIDADDGLKKLKWHFCKKVENVIVWFLFKLQFPAATSKWFEER